MLQDIQTILYKEFKEIIHMRGGRRSGWINLLVVIGILGVYMPLMSGREWVTNPVNAISFAWLPLFMVIGVVVDGIAGERERHTLETLLASRLPDRAILLGKIAAAVLYSLGIGASALLVGGVVANLGSLGEGFVFYPLPVLAGMLGFSLLLAVLIAAVGTLVSLHASTVRQASQTLSLSLLGFWVVVFLIVRFVPRENLAGLESLFTPANIPWLVLGAAGVLLLVDAILIGITMARFQRAKLILD